MKNAFRSGQNLRQIRLVSAFVSMLIFLSPSVDARQAPAGDLDSFMAKVLARRTLNQEALKDYVLNEFEQFEVVGPGDFTLFRGRREYLWYVRDGVHVRSPLRFDGVTIGKTERKEYEDKWIKDEEEKARKKAQSQKAAPPEAQPLPDPGKPSFVTQLSEPRFVSEAFFLDFKFEAGNYYLAGKEKLEGRDVYVIEYYPTDLFHDDETRADSGKKQNKKDKPPSKKEQETDAAIDRQMNKTSMVTLWVDPAEYQIVKYTFSNVAMDFLPASWIVRVDHLKASMVMSQPIPGVWLPKDMSVQAGLGFAVGLYTMRYDRRFSDYKRAEVTTTIRPVDPDKQ